VKLIKIITDDTDMVKPYMDTTMSFDEGIIEIIVGWDLAKENGASILEHKLKENTYWTFSPREKRKLFKQHLKEFLDDFFSKTISKIEIKNLNPLNFKSEEDYIKYIMQHIRGCEGYLYSDKLYVYCGNTIHHIDVGLLKFMSWNIISKIKTLIKLKENKEIPDLPKNLDIKYIPYLNAEKSNISSNIY
jgi:hypothetical protein